MGVEDLRERAAELRGRLPSAAEAAVRVCATLKAGGRPETGDVDLILRALTDFDGGQIRLAEVRPGGSVPETFERLAQALDAAAVETSRSQRLRRLTGVQGPVALEGLLEQVRQAARAGEPRELELLADLIDLAADPNDFQDLDETVELARERLPESWRPLINAALNRRLEIGEAEPQQVQPGSNRAETAPAPSEETSAETGSLVRQADSGSVRVPGVRVTGDRVKGDRVTGDESAALGAPPAFGSGTIKASEIVLEFAEAIEHLALDERTRPGESDLHAPHEADVEGIGSEDAAGAESGGAEPSSGDVDGAESGGADVGNAGGAEPSGGDIGAAGSDSGDAGGADSCGAGSGGAESDGGDAGGADSSGADSGGAESSSAESGGGDAGGMEAGHGGAGGAGGAVGTGSGSGGVGDGSAGGAASEGTDVGNTDVGSAEVGNTEVGNAAIGGGEPRVAEAEMAALRSARFGLAAWLRTAAGRPAVEAQARRCAGLARDMSDFAGRLSAEFAATAQGLDARSLADDPAGGLLAWAAAIRAGIVHPTPESIRLLHDLASVVAPYPGLCAYGEAFADAADSGAYLVPGGSPDARASHAGHHRQRAVRASGRLLEEGPHRRLEPALVEETWRLLVQQDAALGRLLGAAARDDAARVDDVADQVTALRVGETLNALIDETVREVAGGPAESTTTIWLSGMIGDALEVVARWICAVKESATVGEDRLTRALSELRGCIERYEVLAAAELAGPVSAGGPVVAAAAQAARVLIRETLELLDGAPMRTPEPPVPHILNRELLLAPAVRIQSATLVPYESPALAELIPVALAAEEDWEGAFEARAVQGDHEGTRGIIAVLERREPGRVLPLRLRREELVRAARSARDERVQTVRMRVAAGLRDGALDEGAATRIEETLEDLTGPLRDDFGRVLCALHELETEIARGASHNLKLLGRTSGSSAPPS